jgi:hypothetical protein
MTRRWVVVLGAVSLLQSCGAFTRESHVGGQEYWSKEAHFSFRIPQGWEERRSRNPFRVVSYLARFESPEGDAAIVARSVEIGSQSCAEAARAALEASGASAFTEEERFNVVAPEGEFPAWRGTFEVEGERRGRGLVFCEGGTAVALEASASRTGYASRARELAAILDSFAYRGEKRVSVAPAAPTPQPQYFVHVVKFRGQTLGRIADWYTADYENWRKLAEPNGLSAPTVPLKVGREVKIPVELMINRRPLPPPRPRPAAPAEGAVKKSGKGGGENAAQSEKASEEAEEPEEPEEPPAVIGPK